MKIFFHFRHLSTAEYARHTDSALQSRCLIHTCLPVMNQEKSAQQDKPDQLDEQPHMRIEAKAAAEEKGKSFGRFFTLDWKLIDPANYMMHHEIYSRKELHAVKVTHKKFETWHDRVAYAAVRTLRFFFDTFSGYVSAPPKSKSSEKAKKFMTEKLWLRRIIFLESVAGVPGMVAGMSRHMKSLRK